jgi:NodT family efflux transporter outer membrane factor (OMF) lipoprotein
VDGVRSQPDTKPAWLALLLLSLAGCSVGPAYKRPEVKVNNNWSAQHDARVSTATGPEITWWKTFNDPALDHLIDLAYRQNLPLKVAGLRILEARARLGFAVGQQYPQFQVAFGSATVNGVSEAAANTPSSIPADYYNFQVGFDAAWEADFWGKYRKGVSSEEAGYLATIADYDSALVSLAAETARTYAVIRTFQVLIEQAEANVKVQEEGLRIADARFRHGATSELDVSQSKTLLESTRATIPQFQASLAQAENALSTLLGQTTGSMESLLQGPSEIPAPPPEVAISVPADLLRRRADIRSAELDAMAQCDRIGIAKSDFYPRFTLFGRIGTEASYFGDLFGSSSLFYSFGSRLLWPLFNYGRIKNNVRVEDARFQQSLVNYQDTVLRAAQEVEDGLAGFLRSQEAEVFARNAADSAQRSVELAFIQYREGAVDFQRVLDTQRSLLQEQNTLASIRGSVATNLIALYKALGGGWEIREGQPFVDESNRKEMEERTDWGDYFTETPQFHQRSDEPETEPR